MNQHQLLGNRYEIGDLLGRGGMAEVYLGRDTRLSRVVAIKLLRLDLARDPVFQARFRREAQSAASLNHPTIVSVYDTGEETFSDATGSEVALPYIVMEYIDGRTLREMLGAGVPVDLPTAIELTSRVLSALEYSHRSGIVHRDIKPANVMRTNAGDVKVMDFGIARALADASMTMTATQSVIGTAQYLSPEQARGETVDPRSDLYSAGCLLFELVTGRPPFVADSPVAVAYQHVREAPPVPSALNPAIPPELDRVILHALAKDRETRYQTAADFRADLEALLSGRPVHAPAEAAGLAGVNAVPTEVLAQQSAPTRAVPYPAGGATTPLPPSRGWTPTEEPGYAEPVPYPVDRRPRPERRRGRGAGFVVLGLVVAAVFGAAAYLAWSIFGGTQPTTVSVPRVTGLTQANATTQLTAQGFLVDVTEEANEKLDKGVVADQDPKAGTLAEKGSRVTIVVSSGSGNVQVPDVTDLSEAQARARLTEAGLTVADAVDTVDSGKIDKGKVVSTDPAATKTVAKGSAVKLRVSSGQVVVPELTDRPVEDVLKELSALGLSSTQKTEQSDKPEGTVIAQDPQAGTKLEAGAGVVTLTVAVPAPPPPSETTSTDPPSPEPSPEPSPGGEATPTP